MIKELLFSSKEKSEKEKDYKIQTFTYFIPSPPARKTGYREKEFDKITYEILNRGYEIIDLKTQATTNATSSGMWVIFLLRALNENASLLDFTSEEIFSEPVEGLYQIDHE